MIIFFQVIPEDEEVKGKNRRITYARMIEGVPRVGEFVVFSFKNEAETYIVKEVLWSFAGFENEAEFPPHRLPTLCEHSVIVQLELIKRQQFKKR